MVPQNRVQNEQIISCRINPRKPKESSEQIPLRGKQFTVTPHRERGSHAKANDGVGDEEKTRSCPGHLEPLESSAGPRKNGNNADGDPGVPQDPGSPDGPLEKHACVAQAAHQPEHHSNTELGGEAIKKAIHGRRADPS